MATDDFFEEAGDQSIAKTNIVTKYFKAWSNVIISTLRRFGREEKIAYIDLFAGPGRYEDGTPSTPLEILQTAIENADLQKMLVTHFNDIDSNFSEKLEKEINSLPGIESLTYKPRIHSNEIGEEVARSLGEINLVPTLLFVDPWGYKGLSLRLLNSVIKDWGCDCIFFFNYNRINLVLNNPAVKEHMDALFGEERAERLRERVKGLSPGERELIIIEELCQALMEETGSKYILPFTFKNETGNRTSHHLIFVSKHHLGYDIMKDIMAKESSEREEGVASFEYNPATDRQPILFAYSRPLNELGNILLQEFASLKITMGDIFAQHNVGTNYVSANYKDALNLLEEEGKIIADLPADKRPKRQGKITFADKTIVTFPPLKGK